MTYLITITAPAPDPVSPGHEIQHYLRQVDTADIDAVITALDGALKQLPAPRKTRSDAGKPRTQEARKEHMPPKLINSSGEAAKTTASLPEQLVTRKRTAEILSVSTETIKRWTKAGKLNPFRFNSRNLRYKQSEILYLLEQAAGGTK